MLVVSGDWNASWDTADVLTNELLIQNFGESTGKYAKKWPALWKTGRLWIVDWVSWVSIALDVQDMTALFWLKSAVKKKDKICI